MLIDTDCEVGKMHIKGIFENTMKQCLNAMISLSHFPLLLLIQWEEQIRDSECHPY